MNRLLVAGMSMAGAAVLVFAVVVSVQAPSVQAHCQVPCGIYDDAARIAGMREDAATIAKAVGKIGALAGSHQAQGFNQAARWVATKEQHASRIIDVVARYFLTQKVKPVARDADGYEAYLGRLADHHAVMVAAMKCKQKVDAGSVAGLRRAIDALAAHYPPHAH